MALVTMSPLYEDGNFVGVITVSSDTVMFNDMTSDRARAFKEQENVQLREGNENFVGGQWPSQTQTMSSVPNRVFILNLVGYYFFSTYLEFRKYILYQC